MALDPLRPGDMNTQVSIEAPVQTPDGAGGKTTTWDSFATPWAEVVPISGGETFRMGVERSTQFYRIRIWYRGGVTTAHRLLLDGAPLNIRSVEDPDRRRRELMIMAESGVADG